MTHRELFQDLNHYPEIDGVGISLAPEIAAVIFPECVMIFFDEAIIEPTVNFSEVENISAVNRAIVYILADVKRDSDKWNNLEEAKAAARVGLKRKDGKKIQWH